MRGGQCYHSVSILAVSAPERGSIGFRSGMGCFSAPPVCPDSFPARARARKQSDHMRDIQNAKSLQNPDPYPIAAKARSGGESFHCAFKSLCYFCRAMTYIDIRLYPTPK